MQFSQIILFAVASLALISVPGPNMIYVLTRGVSGGKRVGLYSAGGITMGILIYTVLAAIGLASLIKTSPIAFMVVKYSGAAYLLFLGIKTFITSNNSISDEDSPKENNNKNAFWQGVLTNVLNPKVALFILAFIPQFISKSAGSPVLQMIILGSAFASITLLLYGTLGYFTGRIGKWLKSHSKVEKWMHRFSGLVLVGLGLKLAFLQQK
jgi:threonine/homoserine/homoserine lactone efflux protein